MELSVLPRAEMQNHPLGKGGAEPSHWPSPSPSMLQQAQMMHVSWDS